MLHLRLRRAARRDIGSAIRWYNSERQGLGAEFLIEVDTTLRRIRESPLMFSEVVPQTRRALLTRFPYAVFFTPEAEDLVIVLTVSHLHRNPESWRSSSGLADE